MLCTGWRSDNLGTDVHLYLVARILYLESESQPGSRPLGGGKSGLRRAGCQVTPGRREPTESATENIPPVTYPGAVQGRAGGNARGRVNPTWSKTA